MGFDTGGVVGVGSLLRERTGVFDTRCIGLLLRERTGVFDTRCVGLLFKGGGITCCIGLLGGDCLHWGFRVGVLVLFVCLVQRGGSLSLSSAASSGVVVGLSFIFCLHIFTNSPWIHSAGGLLCSTVFVTFVLWLWMGAAGCRKVGFGSLFCSLGLGWVVWEGVRHR